MDEADISTESQGFVEQVNLAEIRKNAADIPKGCPG